MAGAVIHPGCHPPWRGAVHRDRKNQGAPSGQAGTVPQGNRKSGLRWPRKLLAAHTPLERHFAMALPSNSLRRLRLADPSVPPDAEHTNRPPKVTVPFFCRHTPRLSNRATTRSRVMQSIGSALWPKVTPLVALVGAVACGGCARPLARRLSVPVLHYRSLGVRLVCLAIRARMRGPSSSSS
jgi:hypothetical protein